MRTIKADGSTSSNVSGILHWINPDFVEGEISEAKD